MSGSENSKRRVTEGEVGFGTSSSICSSVGRSLQNKVTKYQRIKERRGDGKAIVAIAREITVAMYHMINRKEGYRFSTDAFKTKKT
nr:hypothetical protein BSM_15140 [uncultured archaeon]